jgi:hypothetical protein
MAVGRTRRWLLIGVLVAVGVTCGAVVATRSTSSTTTSATSSTGSSTGDASTVVAVGDIVCSPTSNNFSGGAGNDKNCRAMRTQALAASLNPVAVLPLGDIQYECGTADEFDAFASSWGRFGELLRPAIGNHEYGHACNRDEASAYFSYFGARAGEAGKGWYSFDVGEWHLIALNSECSYGRGGVAVGGCQTGSPQERWLRDDLAAHTNRCSLAYWHEPRFSSGQHGNNQSMTDIWNLLVDKGTDVVLSGHNHNYERFEPLGKTTKVVAPPTDDESGDAVDIQDPSLDPKGITEFVVGTGGKNLYKFSHRPLVGEAVRNDDTYGVLALTLRPGAFDWQFHPVDGGGGFTDSGSRACH